MDKKLYSSKNMKIYYNELDEKTILDIEKSVLEGKNKTLEYFEIQGYDKEIIVVSPLNPGNVHNYEVILEVISKSVADIILKNNFKDVLNGLILLHILLD